MSCVPESHPLAAVFNHEWRQSYVDPCSCPKRGHSNCTIAEGDPNHTIDGKAVAYEGHKTTCGAALEATVENFSKG